MAQKSPAATIGYFTTIESERTGWTGGLLVLNRAGRPLEFQCTLPVRPSKAHTILYGSTLRQHLISEVIGPALLKKCRTPITLLCCDQPEAFSIEAVTRSTIALVVDAAEENEGPITDETMSGTAAVELSGAILRVPIELVEPIEALVAEFADLPDATEPFERIRDAIREAHSQIARAA